MTEALSAVRLLRVPVKMASREMLVGTLNKLDDVENIVVIVNDAEGCWLMTEDGTTSERMNWMLDRAKLLLHKAV
jgi:small nuclear ribonucleoprotein (snRNP)-like protein